MAQGSGPAEGGAWRGIRGATAISAVGLALIAPLSAWCPPPDPLTGLLLIPAWGIALGIFSRRIRPGRPARTVGLVGLVAGATLLNVLWLQPLRALARGAPLVLHTEGLRERALAHWHPLVSDKALYLTLAPLLSGREVHWVASPSIQPRRLMSLGNAGRLVELAPPGAWLPAAAYWERRYQTTSFDLPGKGIERQRLVAVMNDAASAKYYVVLEHRDVILAIPDAAWEAERRLAGPGTLR